ncbi:MAG: LamG-like jellyroll fold domain-containing protein [Phycisphaerales bacterium]
MKKAILVFAVVSVFSTTVRAVDIAISTQANWWSQAAANREMQEIVDNVKAVPIERFTTSDHAALADWVVAHTGDGASDLLILCGQCPATIYAAGNTQPDGSLLELFLDDGNCVINTGDWIFYMVNGAGTNGTAALPNVMDIPSMEMWDDNTSVTVTADGQKYTPSLVNFATDRAIHIDALVNDWYAELILALAADGNRAEPVILRNSVTGGRIGVFFQTANQDDDPRGEVMSEWINNWYLVVAAPSMKGSSPFPEDGAIDVHRDAALSWRAGKYAATHDVYFGTSFEEVSNATEPVQNVTDAAYDPEGLLEYGQTYYWRIDEVNGAPDYTVFPGDVWSFTVEQYAYPITNVTATASAEQITSLAARTIDGSGLDELDQHGTDLKTMWVTPGGLPAWIQYTFDKVYKLHELWVWNSNSELEPLMGFGAKDVAIEYSTDGETWVPLANVPQFAQGTGKTTYTANTTINFSDVLAKYVRLTISDNWGATAMVSLGEVRFFYAPLQAFEPDPADGAVDVSIDATLDWRPGREATSHEVYFGADADAVAGGTVTAETATDHSYTPPVMDLETTYYWKVNEVGDTGTYEGDVWTYTTQKFLVVDDFESYNDDIDAETTIWHTWVDGMTDLASGSQVGYTDAPFAEKTVVHSGRQSMPLQYNNTTFAFSEAKRTFEDAQDWTANGIKTLAIYFRGVSGNGGQLYLKINNTKVVYDGDQADLARFGWQAWNLDLSTVGNVSSVRSLTIGIEGSGVTGKLYVDDIRLYPRAPEYLTPVLPASTNLVGHYTLDEGSGAKANDSSGKGHHGTVIGTVEWTTGMVGGAIVLGGDGDYVDLGNPADWPAGAEARSMCAWAKTEDVLATWHFAVAYGTGATNQAMFIGLNGTAFYGGGYGNDVSISNFWEVDVWHHIALTYDGTTARLYADGIEVASAAKAWNLVRNQARIGQQVNELNEFWNGSVDDVRIYNKALSAEEVAALSGQTTPRHIPF